MQKRDGNEATTDTMFARIVEAQQALRNEAAQRGLGRFLYNDGEFAIRSIDRNLEACTVSVVLTLGLGCRYELSTIVTETDQVDARNLAATFIDWIEAVVAGNAEVAQSRREIKAVTERAISKALREGINIELLGIDIAPIAVGGRAAEAHDLRHPKTLLVCLIMSQVVDGKIVRDEVVIDANRAEEFADYLADSVLPEQREILGL
jgi:hypothetical protein